MPAAKEKISFHLVARFMALLLLLAATAASAQARSAAENRVWKKSAPITESLLSQPLQLLELHQVKAPVRWYDASGYTFGVYQGPAVSVPQTAVGDGVVYLRTDAAGGLKPYVGQSESLARYLVRQSEHANDFPNASFQFDVLGRANPGTDLDVMEEDFIRQLGGPTNKSNPGGLLSNQRYQMNDVRYRAAGGTINKP